MARIQLNQLVQGSLQNPTLGITYLTSIANAAIGVTDLNFGGTPLIYEQSSGASRILNTPLYSNSDGTIPGYVNPGTYRLDITPPQSSTFYLQVDASTGTIKVAGLPTASVEWEGVFLTVSGTSQTYYCVASGASYVWLAFLSASAGSSLAEGLGAGIFKNAEPQWYGTWWTIGNAAGSNGGARTPTSAPATTVGSGGITLPLTNRTVPITDCAQLSANGGSFTLGGFTVIYSGRSVSSGPGSATGCYTLSTALGTYASGTALGFASIGWGPLAVYQKFGDYTGGSGHVVPGTTQAGYFVASYFGPTPDDAQECLSSAVLVKDLTSLGGSAYAQHMPVTSFEADAQIEGGNTMPDGYTAPLLGVGSRIVVLSTPTHVKNAIAFKASFQNTGWVDHYDVFYQNESGLTQYGTLTSTPTFPTASFVVTAASLPPASVSFPATIRIGGNGAGIGGTILTYTGATNNGDGTFTITGAAGGLGAFTAGSRITNTSFGLNIQDPISVSSGMVISPSSYTGSITLAAKGASDSKNSMLLIRGPDNTDSPVVEGLTGVRLLSGANQTAHALEVWDSAGSIRYQIAATGSTLSYGQAHTMQTGGGVSIGQWSQFGSFRSGQTTAAGGLVDEMGAGIWSGGSTPTIDRVHASAGDLYQRSTPTLPYNWLYGFDGSSWFDLVSNLPARNNIAANTGLITMSHDPALGNVASTPTAGTIYGTALYLSKGTTLTYLHWGPFAPAVGTAPTHIYTALLDVTGKVVAVSPDVAADSQWLQSSSSARIPLTGGYVVPASNPYFACFLQVGSWTGFALTLGRSSGLAWSMTGGNLERATFGTAQAAFTSVGSIQQAPSSANSLRLWTAAS